MKQEDIIPTLAKQGESLKSAHKRIDRIEDVGQQIHRLAANMEAMNANTERIAAQQKEQGERMDKVIQALDVRIETLEKEPAAKWKALVTQVITILAAMAAGMLFSRLSGVVVHYYQYL